MLQVYFRQTPVAGVPQAERAYGLTDGAFYPRPQAIDVASGVSREVIPHASDCVVRFPWVQAQAAALPR